MSDDHHVTFLHLAAQNAFASVFLRVEHHGRTREFPDALINTSRLHHATVLSNVAKKDGHTTVLGISMFNVADAAIHAVCVEGLVVRVLCPQLIAENTSRCTAVDAFGFWVNRLFQDGVFLNVFSQSGTVHTLHRSVNQSSLCQFAKQIQHAAGTSTLLHTILLRIGSQFAEERSLAREFVNITHREIHASLLCHSQKVQHSVGRSTHGNVEGHGIEESRASGDAARQHRLVTILIVCQGILHNLTCSSLHQFHTVHVSGQDGAVARQRKANGLGQVVHRVGGEHARAASATGAGTILHFSQFLIAHRLVGTLNHGSNQVEVLAFVLACFHRAAAHKHGRDVQSHGSHQHTRCNLVAVGDTNHRISLVGVAHILHRVGDDVARRKGIEHTIMSHGNAVVDGYGVKLSSITAHLLYFCFHYLTCLMQMGVTWNKLGERVDYRNDRFAKLLTLHAVGNPQSTCSSHTATFCADCTT